jgi:hypothetical protein
MCWSATAMFHAPERLVGHVDWLHRSLPFTHFRLQQGADQHYISPIGLAPVKGHNRRIRAESRDRLAEGLDPFGSSFINQRSGQLRWTVTKRTVGVV